MLAGSLLLDGRVRPRPPGRLTRVGRGATGLWLHGLVMTVLFGLFLAATGSVPLGAVLALACLALFAFASNAKHAMLGEPLLFSDLALVAGMFRHPRFYFTAVARWQWVVASLAGGALAAVLWLLFVPAILPHLLGLGLALAALALLAGLLRTAPVRALALVPDMHADLTRHGLVATLLLYWLRWRGTIDPPPCDPAGQRRAAPAAPVPELIVVVQCESYADPVDLTGDPQWALPGLTAARRDAWQWGQLDVSGFGAYTMRTEYGVLFGRGEAELGFRRYDPFLTALGETSYALPARLAGSGWRSVFVHPHDMRFYDRDRIMPASGFDHLIGEDGFAPMPSDGGRYVTDRAMAARIAMLADQADGPTLIYGVTMENHGPWDSEEAAGADGARDSYLRLVRNGDAMLADLSARLAQLGRPALLVFFGDHRPSIPGVTDPGGARHTPYVMLRFDGQGRLAPGAGGRTDLSPAELHHAILDAVHGPCVHTGCVHTGTHAPEGDDIEIRFIP
ncbi:Phosphoglycerol transferase MdoB [Novosphingobium sp. CF614]|nr:Phosphoglycerol transferase MdoB [Novosphingobium sp. CF614]